MRARRLLVAVPLIAACAVQPAMGFNYPLSPEAIRDAYFLGTGDAAKRAEIFAKYTRTFPTPTAGPYVASIQFETPYIAVADQISQRAVNYHAPDAEQDFLGKPAACRVLVQIYFPYNEFDDFTVELIQGGKRIKRNPSRAHFCIRMKRAGAGRNPNGRRVCRGQDRSGRADNSSGDYRRWADSAREI